MFNMNNKDKENFLPLQNEIIIKRNMLSNSKKKRNNNLLQVNRMTPE